MARRTPPGQELCSTGFPSVRFFRVMDASGISRVPWQSIPCLCPALRPRPDRHDLALCGPGDTAPGFPTPKAPAWFNFEAQPRALASAVYASRGASPGVEPSGSLRKVSVYLHPPFQDFARRYGNVNRQPASVDAAAQYIAQVLCPGLTGPTVLAYAWAAA